MGSKTKKKDDESIYWNWVPDYPASLPELIGTRRIELVYKLVSLLSVSLSASVSPQLKNGDVTAQEGRYEPLEDTRGQSNPNGSINSKCEKSACK